MCLYKIYDTVRQARWSTEHEDFLSLLSFLLCMLSMIMQEACRVRNVMECINRSGQAGLERFDMNPDISALFPFWPYTDSELKNAS